ncbi:MAG: serine/threonine protein kinase, partial [Planctomycetaceae bacterium]|nr:serine/threonine protein kinase [Planctomycetaceae bacterium]
MPVPEEGSTIYAGPGVPPDGQPPTEPASDVPTGSDFDVTVARLLDSLRLPPSPIPSALGRLAHYDIMNVVGSGAMGVVLKAFDNELHRTVAIKVLSSHLITSEEARQRFVREARAAAAINHPNVVVIHAVANHAGVPYLVMEYVDGTSLQQRINRGVPLPVPDILRLSVQIASGLAAAHAHGVIHRDIKPANIMLEDGVERVKITDFGLAKAALANSDLTSFGKMVGTPAYMSPEQVSGDPLDGRSDLFSLGCVMYAMVAGSPPFRGGNCLAVAHNISSSPAKPLREIEATSPQFLEEIVARLLAKDPQLRFQSARELADDLTRRLVRVNQFDSNYVISDPGTTQIRTLPRPVSRFRGWLVGLAAVLSLVGATVAIWVSRPDSNKAPLALVEGGLASRADETANETDAASDAIDDFPAELPHAVRTVGAQPTAEFRTIGEALDRADPGDVIRVLDDGIYTEPLRIESPRHRGLTLEAIAGAQLASPETQTLLVVEATPGVLIRGFRMRLKAHQHGIEVRGRCSGLVIDGLQSEQPVDSDRAFLHMHSGACGTREHPIVIHNLTVRCGGVGLVFTGNRGQPLQWIRLEYNRVAGTGTDWGVPLVLEGPQQDVIITRNLVTNARTGISFAF